MRLLAEEYKIIIVNIALEFYHFTNIIKNQANWPERKL